MCIQAYLREGYDEGAGKVSVPLVEYVKCGEEKGSEMSGERTERSGLFLTFVDSCSEL